MTNRRPVFRSRDLYGPIRVQYYLTRVLAVPRGAEHVVRDVTRVVESPSIRTRSIGPDKSKHYLFIRIRAKDKKMAQLTLAQNTKFRSLIYQLINVLNTKGLRFG